MQVLLLGMNALAAVAAAAECMIMMTIQTFRIMTMMMCLSMKLCIV
jgi:hypothetical protein